jgi:hypothetical protein
MVSDDAGFPDERNKTARTSGPVEFAKVREPVRAIDRSGGELRSWLPPQNQFIDGFIDGLGRKSHKSQSNQCLLRALTAS